MQEYFVIGGFGGRSHSSHTNNTPTDDIPDSIESAPDFQKFWPYMLLFGLAGRLVIKWVVMAAYLCQFSLT